MKACEQPAEIEHRGVSFIIIPALESLRVRCQRGFVIYCFRHFHQSLYYLMVSY